MDGIFSILGQVVGSALDVVEGQVTEAFTRTNTNMRGSRHHSHRDNSSTSVMGSMAFAEGTKYIGSVSNGSVRTRRTKQAIVSMHKPIPEGYAVQSVDVRVVSDPNLPDRFSAKAKLNRDEQTIVIVVQREDAPHGWGQKLYVEWQIFITKLEPIPYPSPAPNVPRSALGYIYASTPLSLFASTRTASNFGASPTNTAACAPSSGPMELFEEGSSVVGSVGNGSTYTSQTKKVVVGLCKTIPNGRNIGRLMLHPLGDSNVSDRFEITGEIKDGRFLHILVRRTDAPHGWGQNLKVEWKVFLQSEHRTSIDATGMLSNEMDELVANLQSAGFPRLCVLDAIELKGCKDADAVVTELCARPVFTHLSTARIRWSSEEELYAHWTAPRSLGGVPGCLFFPEFKAARQRVIVSQELWGSCAMTRDIRALDEFVTANHSEGSPFFGDDNSDEEAKRFASLITEVIQITFNNVMNMKQARTKRVEVKGYGNENSNILQGCAEIFRDLGPGWRRVSLSKAVYVILIRLREKKNDIPGHLRKSPANNSGIIEAMQTEVKLHFALLVRASGECMARKNSATSTVVRAVAQGLSAHRDNPGTDLNITSENASEAVKYICANYIDGLKEKAFRSVFLEPAKLLARAASDSMLHDDVDVHGSNTYKTLLTASLGVGLPDPAFGGDAVKGVCDALQATVQLPKLREAVTRGLWASENLGRSFESISLCTRALEAENGWVHALRCFVLPSDRSTAIEHANNAMDPDRPTGAEERRQLAEYLEQYAFYFSRDFLLERLFTHVTVDEGSGRGLALLESVAQSYGFVDSNGSIGGVRAWVYNEEYVFQPDRAVELFGKIGVIDEEYVSGIL